MLFSKPPLTLEQLCFDMLSGNEPGALLRWDHDEITQDVIRRFIVGTSKGLSEVTTSIYPKVQFIHESVRDVLLKEKGLGNIWSDLRRKFHGQSHEWLKRCCLNQISMKISTAFEIHNCPSLLPLQQAIEWRRFAKHAIHIPGINCT